jgi:NAD(P)-dependent dehydrogenase (short-subunit alcohol dehydrogenase family)
MMMENMFDITDKVAVITGGAGLLGVQFAKVLADYGATVILTDYDLKECKEKVEELSNKKIMAMKLDVTSESDWRDVLTKTFDHYGRIDILVNGAAYTNKTKTESFNNTFENATLDSWNQMLDVNLTGSFLGCQAAARYMKERKEGSIINIASLYGVVSPNHKMYPGTGIVQPVAYTVSKHGVIGLTKYAATWLAEDGIRVNCITPGGIFDNHSDLFLERFGQLSPNGRMTNKNELNGALIYLASNASSSVIGQNLIVDGGWTVW